VRKHVLDELEDSYVAFAARTVDPPLPAPADLAAQHD
jgi:hypothetical protein